MREVRLPPAAKCFSDEPCHPAKYSGNRRDHRLHHPWYALNPVRGLL